MNDPPEAASLEFARVHDEFRPRIHRYLVRLVGALDADDLTQETFVRVSQALGGFRREAALSTWLYRIATNVALDRLRSRDFRLGVRTAVPEAIATLAERATIEQDIARREMSECVRAFVERLPADYRSVTVLSEFEGLPDREIAEVLGVSLETVKIRLHRARVRLREMLEGGCAFSRDERNELTCEPKPGDVSSPG